MSITDELRKVAAKTECANGRCEKLYRGDLDHIADRIDAEHQKALDEWKAEHGQMWLKGYSECHAELLEGNETLASDLERCGWIRLPKNADGEYIHIGDAVTCGATVWTVTGLKLLGEGWGIYCTVYNEYGGSGTSVYPPSDLRHYHAPTVEDVLREFTDEVWNRCCEGATASDSGIDELVAEYAAKLRLAGEDE